MRLQDNEPTGVTVNFRSHAVRYHEHRARVSEIHLAHDPPHCCEATSLPAPGISARHSLLTAAAISPAWWLSSIADLSVPGATYTGPAPLKGAHLVQAYLNLYRKYALQHDRAQLQHGEISQIDFSKYFMMQGLLLPPREVINMSALTTLLTSDPSSEEQQLLAEFCQHYPDHFEEILSEVVPDFAGAFGQ